MPTFPRGHANHNVHTGNAKLIIRLSPPEPKSKTARYTFSPGDHHTLRGIPALSEGVASVMPGTSPHIEGVRRADAR